VQTIEVQHVSNDGILDEGDDSEASGENGRAMQTLAMENIMVVKHVVSSKTGQ
jgi:hypothetical protein